VVPSLSLCLREISRDTRAPRPKLSTRNTVDLDGIIPRTNSSVQNASERLTWRGLHKGRSWAAPCQYYDSTRNASASPGVHQIPVERGPISTRVRMLILVTGTSSRDPTRKMVCCSRGSRTLVASLVASELPVGWFTLNRQWYDTAGQYSAPACRLSTTAIASTTCQCLCRTKHNTIGGSVPAAPLQVMKLYSDTVISKEIRGFGLTVLFHVLVDDPGPGYLVCWQRLGKVPSMYSSNSVKFLETGTHP
jgi:hypothetical protein